MQVAQTKHGIGRVGQIESIELPLVSERLGSCGGDPQLNPCSRKRRAVKHRSGQEGRTIQADRTAADQRHIMSASRRDCHHSGQCGRNVGLVAPANDAAINLECQAVIAARSDRHNIRQAGRKNGLSVAVVAPGDDGAVAL